MDKTQYSGALRNAVAFLKGQKKIKKEIEISIDTGFSKGAVSNYLTGKQVPSDNFIEKFVQVYDLKLEDFAKEISVQINNPDSIIFETLLRTESQARVNASYIAEIYGHLLKVPATKVLKDMEQMVDSDTLRNLAKLKGR